MNTERFVLSKCLLLKEKVINVCSVLCIAMAIIFFANIGNQYYQTLKDIEAAKALFMVSLFIMITQRVRLLNWQSLLGTLLLLPVGYMYRSRFIESADLFNRDKIVPWIVWMLLMVAIDMAVYKKVNRLDEFRKLALLLYSLTTVFLIFYRNNTNQPLLFVMIAVFFFIPMDEEKWSALINQICYGWIGAFYVILYWSITTNLEVSSVNGRWYGWFLNIGDFGVFLVGVTAVLLYKIYSTKSIKGWRNWEFILCIGTSAPLFWTICRVSTLTMFVGLAMIVCAWFVFVRKDKTAKAVGKRIVGLLLFAVLVAFGTICGLKMLAQLDAEYWNTVLKEGNTFVKPFAEFVKRAGALFGDENQKWTLGVFEEGTLIEMLDVFSSGRVSLIKIFLENSTFTGCGTLGIQVNDYFAFNAHNSHTQYIYQYGFVGGGLFLLWILYQIWMSVRECIRRQDLVMAYIIFVIAGLNGAMVGEVLPIYSPMIFTALLLAYPIIINEKEPEKDEGKQAES